LYLCNNNKIKSLGMKKIVLLGMFVFGFAFAASAQTDKPAAEQKTKACCKSKAAGESKECNKVAATAEAKACCKSKTANAGEAKACCKSKTEGPKCEGKHEASEKKHNCADHKNN
jgi:hypothetical protein